MTTMAIRLSDETGKIYRWNIERVPRAVNCTYPKIRVISGWQFTDHDGYIRFAEGNWLDLVAMFRLVATNYGLTLVSELS